MSGFAQFRHLSHGNVARNVDLGRKRRCAMDILNRRNAIKASALLSAGAFASRALMPVAAAADQTPAAPSGAPPVAMATHYGPASATGSVAEVYQKARQNSLSNMPCLSTMRWSCMRRRISGHRRTGFRHVVPKQLHGPTARASQIEAVEREQEP